MLVEIWLSSSVKARESALILRLFGVHRAFLELLCCTWCSSRLWVVVSGNLWSCIKVVKSIVLFDVERSMALEPMHMNQASSRVDLRYTELFCIAAVTSGSLSSCDSVLGDSLEFHQVSQGSLRV